MFCPIKYSHKRVSYLRIECYHYCGQSSKAFSWHKGKEKEIRKHDVQHDLEALWNMAYEEGLGIPQVPPDWVTILSSGHKPYYFRYQKGQGGTIVDGGPTPALIPMRDALKNLIEMVGLVVKA